MCGCVILGWQLCTGTLSEHRVVRRWGESIAIEKVTAGLEKVRRTVEEMERQREAAYGAWEEESEEVWRKLEEELQGFFDDISDQHPSTRQTSLLKSRFVPCLETLSNSNSLNLTFRDAKAKWTRHSWSVGGCRSSEDSPQENDKHPLTIYICINIPINKHTTCRRSTNKVLRPANGPERNERRARRVVFPLRGLATTENSTIGVGNSNANTVPNAAVAVPGAPNRTTGMELHAQTDREEDEIHTYSVYYLRSTSTVTGPEAVADADVDADAKRQAEVSALEAAIETARESFSSSSSPSTPDDLVDPLSTLSHQNKLHLSLLKTMNPTLRNTKVQPEDPNAGTISV
ncbi:uncharacterized protein BDV17DRAFT_291800 [Aspergillus undulatus]|uniref:uncharacterized protein n=1 Tax=Aspergillus undulatus TaxID=1810928 RepID=UPI003CCD57C6